MCFWSLVIKRSLNTDKIVEIIGLIPEEWLLDEADDMSPTEIRAAYIEYINAKLAMMDTLVKESENAR